MKKNVCSINRRESRSRGLSEGIHAITLQSFQLLIHLWNKPQANGLAVTYLEYETGIKSNYRVTTNDGPAIGHAI